MYDVAKKYMRPKYEQVDLIGKKTQKAATTVEVSTGYFRIHFLSVGKILFVASSHWLKWIWLGVEVKHQKVGMDILSFLPFGIYLFIY